MKWNMSMFELKACNLINYTCLFFFGRKINPQNFLRKKYDSKVPFR